MKTSLIILVILGLTFEITHSEICQCLSYLISEGGLSNENKITSNEFDLNDTLCDGDLLMQCKSFCVEMYKELTDNGRTCSVMPNDNKRFGDWICEALNRNVCNARVGIFVQSCGSDVVDTGFRFVETICCKSGRSIHC
ncbi:uncharacterized protein LOC118181190 isoform X1 [Stegodyphus dumicola]|uniref:uncharacterized protein LOC118181190 isoform X1 n=1 Tax=Stegodyphus dumicola TaxID=202533 RepID=UPI0015AEE181|nr:uncharacterized protein LOC118181190 isoform X1 [Stegodyphus dumicola]